MAAASEAGDAAGYALGSPGYRRVTVGLGLAGVATFATLYAPQPLLPQLSAWFGVGAGAAALSISVCTLGLAIGLLVAGPLSDARGRTTPMLGSLLASALLGLAAAAAPTWHLLLAVRTLQGLALAGLPAVAMAYLREEVDPAVHVRAASLYVAGTAIGGMLGRLVSGGLADLAGWRGALAGVAVLTLGCAVAVWRLLPRSRRFRPQPARARTLAETSARQLRDPVLLGLFGVAATLMGAFVGVYNALSFRLTAAPYLLGGAAALVFLVYPVGSLGSALAGRLAERLGRRAATPAAVAVMLAGLLLTGVSPLAGVVAGTAVLTFGFFAAHALASGWVAARAFASGGGVGQASALYLLAYYGGSSVFGALAASAWTAGGWAAVTSTAAALTVTGGLLALALARSRPLGPGR